MRSNEYRAWDGKKMWYQTYGSLCVAYVTAVDFQIHIGQWVEDGKKWIDFIVTKCVGLRDKNKQKIYAGDIVKWDDNSNGDYWRVAVVEVKPDIQFRIVKNTVHPLSCDEGRVFHFGNFIYQETEKYLEVIGNVFENPDLLTPNNPTP